MAQQEQFVSQSFPFGILNPQFERPTKQFNYEQYETSFEIISRIIKENNSYDAMKSSGPFRGIVLSIEENEGIKPSTNSWVDSAYSDINRAIARPNLPKIRVRIPELHAYLPEPNINDPSNIANISIISAHPIFIGISTDLPIPAIGSIVMVDFGNRETMEDPRYIGIVSGDKTSMPLMVNNSIKSLYNQNGNTITIGESTMPKVKGNIKEKVTLFVIHETDGEGKVNPETGRAHAPAKSVCLWIGRDGSVAQTLPVDEMDASSNWCANPVCLAAEICNPTYKVSATTSKPYLLLGKGGKGLFDTKTTFSNNLTCLPSEIQCRRIWELINLANSQFPEKVIIPIKFPGNGNQDKFIWYRYSGNNKPGIGQGTKAINDYNITMPWWGANKDARHGITSHMRWHHGDGLFPEYYCVGRSIGMSSVDAYAAAIGASASVSKRVTSFNPYAYLIKGHAMIESLGGKIEDALNPRISNSDYPPDRLDIKLKDEMTIRKVIFNAAGNIVSYSNPQPRFFTREEF